MSESLVGGFSYAATRYPKCNRFIQELQALCGKHGVMLVHKADSVRIFADSGDQIGTLLLVRDGRLIWAPDR